MRHRLWNPLNQGRWPIRDKVETVETFQALWEETGLPLIGLEEPTYPQLCIWAATNQAIAGAAGA